MSPDPKTTASPAEQAPVDETANLQDQPVAAVEAVVPNSETGEAPKEAGAELPKSAAEVKLTSSKDVAEAFKTLVEINKRDGLPATEAQNLAIIELVNKVVALMDRQMGTFEEIQKQNQALIEALLKRLGSAAAEQFRAEHDALHAKAEQGNGAARDSLMRAATGEVRAEKSLQDQRVELGITEANVKEGAYFIWEKKGRKENRTPEEQAADYHEAEAELIEAARRREKAKPKVEAKKGAQTLEQQRAELKISKEAVIERARRIWQENGEPQNQTPEQQAADFLKAEEQLVVEALVARETKSMEARSKIMGEIGITEVPLPRELAGNTFDQLQGTRLQLQEAFGKLQNRDLTASDETARQAAQDLEDQIELTIRAAKERQKQIYAEFHAKWQKASPREAMQMGKELKLMQALMAEGEPVTVERPKIAISEAPKVEGMSFDALQGYQTDLEETLAELMDAAKRTDVPEEQAGIAARINATRQTLTAVKNRQTFLRDDLARQAADLRNAMRTAEPLQMKMINDKLISVEQELDYVAAAMETEAAIEMPEGEAEAPELSEEAAPPAEKPAQDSWLKTAWRRTKEVAPLAILGYGLIKAQQRAEAAKTAEVKTPLTPEQRAEAMRNITETYVSSEADLAKNEADTFALIDEKSLKDLRSDLATAESENYEALFARLRSLKPDGNIAFAKETLFLVDIPGDVTAAELQPVIDSMRRQASSVERQLDRTRQRIAELTNTEVERPAAEKVTQNFVEAKASSAAPAAEHAPSEFAGGIPTNLNVEQPVIPVGEIEPSPDIEAATPAAAEAEKPMTAKERVKSMKELALAYAEIPGNEANALEYIAQAPLSDLQDLLAMQSDEEVSALDRRIDNLKPEDYIVFLKENTPGVRIPDDATSEELQPFIDSLKRKGPGAARIRERMKQRIAELTEKEPEDLPDSAIQPLDETGEVFVADDEGKIATQAEAALAKAKARQPKIKMPALPEELPDSAVQPLDETGEVFVADDKGRIMSETEAATVEDLPDSAIQYLPPKNVRKPSKKLAETLTALFEGQSTNELHVTQANLDNLVKQSETAWKNASETDRAKIEKTLASQRWQLNQVGKLLVDRTQSAGAAEAPAAEEPPQAAAA